MPFTSIPNEILGRAINDPDFRTVLTSLQSPDAVNSFLKLLQFDLPSAVAEEIANFNTDPAFQATIREELGLDETAM